MKTIHKAAAIVIQNNEFLMVRKKGKDIWTSLGGKVEAGETEEQALLREIKEEFDCQATILKKLGDFTDKAVFDDAEIKLSAFLVDLSGPINLLDAELDEYRFLPKTFAQEGIKMPSTMQEKIIPYCITQGLLKW